MKKLFVTTTAVFSFSMLYTPIVSAQDSIPSSPISKDFANLFSWAISNPPNWTQGILYAILGLAGALITIYFIVGGTIPTSAGAKLESEFKELDTKVKELSELRKKALENPASIKADLIEAFSDDEDRLRDDLERKRQNIFRTWVVLYMLLGIFFAVMLAQDLFQAITIGAGWTSVLAAFGLNKESKEAKADASKQADILEQSIKDLEKKLTQLKMKSDEEKLVWDPVLDFEDTIKTAEDAVRLTKLRSKAF